MIIEYFYKNYKRFLFRKDLPLYLAKMSVFVVTVIYNENSIQYHFDSYDKEVYEIVVYTMCVLQTLSQFYQMYLSYLQYICDKE